MIETRLRPPVEPPSKLPAIEALLWLLPIGERRAMARRIARPARRPRVSDRAADRLLAVLRRLAQERGVLPTNRELAKLAKLAKLEGENISYLLSRLRRAGLVTIEIDPWRNGPRTFRMEIDGG